MKFGYKLSNVLGRVYSKGGVIFSEDGTTLLSPIGARVVVFDLVK
jgi:periodic tryptophan protein 2